MFAKKGGGGGRNEKTRSEYDDDAIDINLSVGLNRVDKVIDKCQSVI